MRCIEGRSATGIKVGVFRFTEEHLKSGEIASCGLCQFDGSLVELPEQESEPKELAVAAIFHRIFQPLLHFFEVCELPLDHAYQFF